MSTAKNPAAVALGRLGGRSKSQAKAEAVRANGRKGGRPKGSRNRPKFHLLPVSISHLLCRTVSLSPSPSMM